MALEIKSPPVLRGKAAQEFYKKVAEFKCTRSNDEVKKVVQECRTFLAEQEHLHPTTW